MNIGEAIKELELINHDGFVITRYTEYDALKLGIEALKEIRYLQRMDADFKDYILPSETK